MNIDKYEGRTAREWHHILMENLEEKKQLAADKLLGIVWGLEGVKISQNEGILRIVSYWSDEQKNMAIKAFEVLGYWEIGSATTDDLNVGLSDLIREARDRQYDSLKQP